MTFVPDLLASSSGSTLIDARWYDYFPIVVYFAFVIGVGFMARRKAASSDEFLTSGRSLPAWVTGIAFVSANLGAVEIMGMSANGAQYGLPTFHYFWIGAIPAMIFLGLVMMPFYYGSKVRSVPEFMFRRYGTAAHLINALSFALAQLLIAGVNLYLLGSIVQRLLGWPLWVALVVAAIIVSTIPMMVGVAIVALVPGVGELRSLNPWLLLHFLWMYPAARASSLVISPVLKHLFATGNSRKFGELLEDLLIWLLISWFFTVFFRDPLGALLAGLISAVTMKPFVTWLEKHAPKDEDDPGDDEVGKEGVSE